MKLLTGDTISINFEATVDSVSDTDIWIRAGDSWFGAVPPGSDINVVNRAKKPVYVNSDATEFSPGDVYTVKRNGEDRVVYVNYEENHYYAMAYGGAAQNF